MGPALKTLSEVFWGFFLTHVGHTNQPTGDFKSGNLFLWPAGGGWGENPVCVSERHGEGKETADDCSPPET